MIHFLGEILLLILFTALLWFGIGWWVSSIERNKTLRSREEEWRHYLNTLRRDRDSFRDEVEKAHGRIRVLENRRADGQSPPQSAELAEEERKKYEHNIQELQEKFLNTERKMLGFSQHVETLHSQNLEREHTLVQFKKKIAELTETLHQREQRLDALSMEAANQVNDSQFSEQEPDSQEQEKDETIAQLKATVAANETTARRATVLEMALADKTREIEQLQQIIEATSDSTAADSRQQVTELKNLVREQEFTITQLRDQAANTNTAELDEEIVNMREVMTEQEEIISQLRAVLDKATRQSARQPRPKKRVPVQDAEPTPRSGDLFADAAGTSNSLRASEEPGQSAQSSSLTLTGGEQNSGRPATVSVRLFDQAPAKSDDLKVINGIGPAFEKTLNRLGIYQFEQIASLSGDDIEWVARELNSFAERIVRDQWIAQARALENAPGDGDAQ